MILIDLIEQKLYELKIINFGKPQMKIRSLKKDIQIEYQVLGNFIGKTDVAIFAWRDLKLRLQILFSDINTDE